LLLVLLLSFGVSPTGQDWCVFLLSGFRAVAVILHIGEQNGLNLSVTKVVKQWRHVHVFMRLAPHMEWLDYRPGVRQPNEVDQDG
jgi:hypothetical protein